VVLVCMLLKFVTFLLGAWLLLDPNCPCGIATLFLWLEGTANSFNVLRKVVLLLRFELRAALDHKNEVPNMFVRWRHLLRARWQFVVMIGMLLFVGMGYLTVLGVFVKEAPLPCLNDRILNDGVFFWSMMATWMVVLPMLFLSMWATKKLKSHPKDNWKIGVESAVSSIYAMITLFVPVIILVSSPGFESIIFMLFVTSIFLPLLNFLLPMYLHRQSMKLLSRMQIHQLTSLARLLKDATFLATFDKFLRTEFASENLFFWREVEKIGYQHPMLLPANYEKDSQSSQSQSRPSTVEKKRTPEEEDSGKQLLAAAAACLNLERQCVGDQAPWQINISGDTADALENSLMRLKDVLGTDRESRELKGLLEDVVRSMLSAKTEVYEALRKDSYPRFLLSEDCARLNGNENFKRLLAAEKWDDEVQRTTTPPSPRHSVDDHKKSLSYEVTLTAPGTILWGKQPRPDTLEPPSSSAERASDGAERGSFNSEGRSNHDIEIRVEPQPTETTDVSSETAR